MKIINAVFGGSAFAKTQKVFQWDGDDKLVFLGVDLPENYQVHFSNSITGTSKTVLGTPDGVMIPPEFFVPGSEIYAWVWISGDNGSGYTKYQVTVPIYARAQPSDESPTPQQQSALDQAIAALNDAAEEIPNQIDTALAEAKASGEFDGEDGAPGAPGVGVPPGGTTGQVLAKASDADNDTQWVDPSGGSSLPSGGESGQILRLYQAPVRPGAPEQDPFPIWSDETSDKPVYYDFTLDYDSQGHAQVMSGPTVIEVIDEVEIAADEGMLCVARMSWGEDSATVFLPLTSFLYGSTDAYVEFSGSTEGVGNVLCLHGDAYRNQWQVSAYEPDEIVQRIGDLDDLETDTTDNLVAAINELHQQIASLTNASGVSF